MKIIDHAAKSAGIAKPKSQTSVPSAQPCSAHAEREERELRSRQGQPYCITICR